jgi:hypothetical protein
MLGLPSAGGGSGVGFTFDDPFFSFFCGFGGAVTFPSTFFFEGTTLSGVPKPTLPFPFFSFPITNEIIMSNNNNDTTTTQHSNNQQQEECKNRGINHTAS